MTIKRALLLLGVAALTYLPAIIVAQEGGYPIELVAPGKSAYTFPPGYTTPWDKVEIKVTEKMSPNLFVLHGSQGLDPAHPARYAALADDPKIADLAGAADVNAAA